MEIREPLDQINFKLNKNFGYYTEGYPYFRVVWSDDQFEKRWTNFDDKGNELLQAEIRELPKYRQWCPGRFVLERLVPLAPETDVVPTTVGKYGYEPAWVFQDRNQNYLPPFYDGCVFVIDSLLQAAGKANTHAKYKDPNATIEEREAMIQKVQDDLFGNETDTGDHLAYGTGVVVPESPAVLDIKEQIQKAESKIELSKLIH